MKKFIYLVIISSACLMGFNFAKKNKSELVKIKNKIFSSVEKGVKKISGNSKEKEKENIDEKTEESVDKDKNDKDFHIEKHVEYKTNESIKLSKDGVSDDKRKKIFLEFIKEKDKEFITRKYNISLNDLRKIAFEGVKKGWKAQEKRHDKKMVDFKEYYSKPDLKKGNQKKAEYSSEYEKKRAEFLKLKPANMDSKEYYTKLDLEKEKYKDWKTKYSEKEKEVLDKTQKIYKRCKLCGCGLNFTNHQKSGYCSACLSKMKRRGIIIDGKSAYGKTILYYEKDGKKYYVNCLKCGEKLKNPADQLRGYGKFCWSKHNSKDQIFITKELSLFHSTELVSKSII